MKRSSLRLAETFLLGERQVYLYRSWIRKNSVTSEFLRIQLRPVVDFFLPLALVSYFFVPPVIASEPVVFVKGVKLELVAENPDIVTPIGMTFDSQGRLLVIESHTHFRPEDYQGPEADRIRLMTRSNSGTAEFKTFYDGLVHTMSIQGHRNGWVYVATRKDIFRLRDADGDGTAETREDLVHLETKGDYPHNGLGGLAVDRHGNVHFGLGENLGEPYQLIGADKVTLIGGGEGGNIYRITPDGTGLTRLATGFWNPFGICVDSHDRIFAVGNDPSSTPPCRLVHVVPGADFGFQYRYGRTGSHPLQAWNGELPGTLPMVAATGEAPCDVKVIRGALWSTSWGHNRIERFVLQPHGASWRAQSEVIISGDDRFRPVCFAEASDGTLYFSDWVDRSYPVHGFGRIWKITFENKDVLRTEYPSLTVAERDASTLRQHPRMDRFNDDDVFIRQANVWGLIQSPSLPEVTWSGLSPKQKIGWLQALRWRSEGVDDALLRGALKDGDSEVRLYGVRIVADDQRNHLRDDLEQMLATSVTSPWLLRAVVAALEHLESQKITKKSEQQLNDRVAAVLWSVIEDTAQPIDARAAALSNLSSSQWETKRQELATIAKMNGSLLGETAIWKLAVNSTRHDLDVLVDVAKARDLPENHRAIATMALAADRESFRSILQDLATDSAKSVRLEAQRALASNEKQETSTAMPPTNATDQWMELVASQGDKAAGERLFFSRRGVACSQCHAHQNRGADIGPDLTTIGRQLDRRRLLIALLEPSRDIAPQYRAETFLLDDGRVITGSVIGYRNMMEIKDSDRREFLDVLQADGQTASLCVLDIESRHDSSLSIMPAGLHRQFSVTDLRDILTFLESSVMD